MTEIEVLEDRLRSVDARRVQIDAILDREQGDSYKRQELQTERAQLMSLRRATDDRLRSLNTPAVSTPDTSRSRFIEQEIVLRRRRYEGDIAQCEAAGDHRQARLWRGELLKVREQVIKEFGLPV